MAAWDDIALTRQAHERARDVAYALTFRPQADFTPTDLIEALTLSQRAIAHDLRELRSRIAEEAA